MESSRLARAGRRSWQLLGVLVVAYLALQLLIRLHLIVVPVIIAIILAAVVSIPARWMQRHGVPPALASTTAFLGLLGVLAGVWWLILPPLIDQVGQFGDALGQARDQVLGWLRDGPLHLSRSQLNNAVDAGIAKLRGNTGAIISGIFSGASTLVGIVTGAIASLVLTFFFVKDGDSLFRGLLGMIPAGPTRRVIGEVGPRIGHTLRAFAVGTTLDGLVEAALKAATLLVLGVPLVLPLATLTFLGGYLPFVGALLAGTVSASVALVTKGPLTALIVIIAAILIQNIEGHLLQPLIMGRAVKSHPAVILVSVSAGAILGGIIGAFLAVPTLACARTLLDYLRERHMAPSYGEGATGGGADGGEAGEDGEDGDDGDENDEAGRREPRAALG